ncbi:MAG: hypothetical protein JSR96_04030 [Proteobacteria bacterium]|nr:hypothetical protein [Pseudomonadota bacterium]
MERWTAASGSIPWSSAATFAAEAGRGLGVVVDYLWGRPAELLIGQVARPDLHSAAGDSAVRFVSVGTMAAPDITLPSNALRGSRRTDGADRRGIAELRKTGPGMAKAAITSTDDGHPVT